MATLTGTKIKDTYKSLVKVTDNAEAGSTGKQLSDGNGNNLGLYVDTDGVFGIGGAASVSLDISSKTDAVAMPKGTDAQRPTGTSGHIRYNTTDSKLEFYDSDWRHIATEAFVNSSVAALVDSAPGTLDTLNEIAAALNDDASFYTTITNLIATKQDTITGAATTITGSNLTASRAVVSNSSGKVAVSAVTDTELGYLDGVTSSVQTQLDSMQSQITGGATTVTDTDLTASRAIVSNSSGKLAVSDVTDTEVGYLDGVTSAIQTQLDGKQPTITGAATSIDTETLTASKVLISDSSGKVAVGSATSTEVSYLSGVSSAIQTQMDGKQAIVSGVSDTEIGYLDGVTSAIQTQIDGKQAIVSGVSDTEIGYLDGVTSAIQTQIDSKQATITGAATTIDDTDLTASRAVISNASGKIAISDVTSTELGYLDGVTSAVQTQIDSKQAILTGATTTVTGSNLTASRAVVSNSSGKVAVSDVTDTELGYLDGVTSGIQSQLDSMQATITGGAVTITDTDLTANRALISNATGKVTVSAVTNTELGYLDGVTSAVQTQIDGKQAIVSGVSDTEIGYLDGVTSAIQTQIDSKQATITGAATTIDDTDLTASRAVVSNASGKVAVSAVTSTELGYLDGVTSAIQTQLDAKPTYTVSAADGDNSDEEKIVLTGSDSSTDAVVLEAGTGLTIARDGDKITFTNTVTDTDTQLTAEQVEDIVGAMVSGNTESGGIVVTYDDTNDKLDFAFTLADDAVVTAKILDGNVTLAKIADQAANTVIVRDANSSGDLSAKAVADTEILIGDGSGFTAASLSGDVTMTNAGAVTIANDAITGAKIHDSAALPNGVTATTQSASDNSTKVATTAYVDTAVSAGGGGGGVEWETTAKTSNFTAVSGKGYFIDTSSGAVTATLPSSPSAGDLLGFLDYAATFQTNSAVLTSSKKILASNDDMALDGKNQMVELVFSGDTKGWLISGAANEGTEVLSAAPIEISCLVVAGGGGGSSTGQNVGGTVNLGGGGGGAGEFLVITGQEIELSSNYTVGIGAGGANTVGSETSGSDTKFLTAAGQSAAFNYTCNGGGRGAKRTTLAADGGSGGGGIDSAGYTAGGSSSKNEAGFGSLGNDGGDGQKNTGSSIYAGGGGGGAGAAGQDGASDAGDGGVGYATTISSDGSSTYYAGGGGGGGYAGTDGVGGNGGGGNCGSSGTANTGGGGGGGTGAFSGTNSGNGGSGVVIVKYPDSLNITVGGSLTSSTDSSSVSGFKITTFTAGEDNISWAEA